ncbi:MAG: porin, partial [Armatimonadota bacterium]
MLKKLTQVATCSCALTVLSMALHAQASDVPPGHWAFEAVEDLASKGLVLGYPDGTFMGQRALTRYEMAAIVQRILKQVDEKGKTAPAISSSADADSTPKVTPEQLAEIAKLVEEYKVELTVMGTDLASVKEQVGLLRQDFDTLKGDFDPVKSTVMDPEGGLQTVINDVAKMKKITVSGYIQARYFSAARQANTAIAPYSGGLYANRNDFQVRRARLKVTATPSKYITAVGQIDFPTNSAEAVSLKDAYVTYNIGGVPDIYPQVSIGQMNWPFGFEVPRSSSDRETPERSEFLRTLFP